MQRPLVHLPWPGVIPAAGRDYLRNLSECCTILLVPRSTLAEIAAATGVTVPTVSKVLNGRSDVSPETRVRVLELLAESGYRRRGRQGLAADQTPVSGFIDVILNPVGKSWAIEVVGGIQRIAAAAGFDVVVSIPKGDTDWVDRVIRRGSRGVITERWLIDNTDRDRLLAAHVPFVVIDPGAEPPLEVPSVGATNWKGGYSAAEHLVALGHRRIAIMGGNLDTLASRARVDGFKSALAAHGVDFDPELETYAQWSRTQAEIVGADLLGIADPPTAVFACSDRMASGLYLAARRLGLSIPDDLSVVGFDDLPEVGWLIPSLTTVHQPVEEMARTALQLILARNSADDAGGAQRIELSTTLIERESTAAPRR